MFARDFSGNYHDRGLNILNDKCVCVVCVCAWLVVLDVFFPPSLEMMIPLDLGRKHSARRCQQKESCVSAGSYSTCLPAIIARSVFKRCIRTFGGGCFEFASRLRHESHGFFTSFKPIDFDHLISEICGRWACAPENSDVARTFAEAVGSATIIFPENITLFCARLEELYFRTCL